MIETYECWDLWCETCSNRDNRGHYTSDEVYEGLSLFQKLLTRDVWNTIVYLESINHQGHYSLFVGIADAGNIIPFLKEHWHCVVYAVSDKTSTKVKL